MRLPHVTWLRAFEAAARHASFSDAAEELHLTPAAVSQQIRLLEKFLGATLFERLPRGVALTDMGHAYAVPIRKSFSEMLEATDGLFTIRQKQTLHVRASISFAALVLAPRLADFRALHPDIELTLSTAVGSDRMEQEHIDVDIRYGTGQWSEPEIWKLADEVATLVCHPKHLQMLGPNPTVQSCLCSGTVQVVGSETEWRRLSELFELDLPSPPIWLKADSSLIALQTVAAGFGTALIHESFSHPYIERGQLVSPFSIRLPMREAYYMVMRNSDHLREEITIFREWLTTAMR